MEFVIIFVVGLFLVAGVCYGLADILENIDNTQKQKEIEKKRAEENHRESILRPVMKEIIDEEREEYENELIKEEYFNPESKVRKMEDVVLFVGDMNETQIYGEKNVWKNDNNLCITVSFSYNEDMLQNSMRSMWAYNAINNKSIDEFKQYMKEQIPLYYISIPIENILYFMSSGEKYVTTNVYGGGGTVGGSSTKGAIAGGILAGNTGAVIGSRKETVINSVRSETQIHDEKMTILKYRNKSGELKDIIAKHGHEMFYNVLKDMIPEKEYAYCLAQSRKNSADSNSEDAVEKLSKLKTLHEKKLITKEEYDEKRREVLEKI